jgi:tetratricopeptide (TPR) repeat protein
METNTFYEKGKLAAKAKNYAEAVKFYEKALEISPENADLFSDRGVAYFHLKKYRLSLLDMDRAVKLESENPYRYSSRAYIKGFLKDTEGAIADYEIAIQLDPEDAIAFNNLGLLQEQLGYKAKAEKNFNAADKIAEQNGWNDQLANHNPTTEKTKSSTQEAAEEKTGFWREIASVFTDKNKFKEFIRFIGNGFKIKD